MDYERDIERKDFPLSRRGYDPAAVDAHLARLATEIRDETRRTTPISENVSRQIKSIISVAEDAAHEVRSSADDDAAEMRSSAAAESRDHVGRVTDASGTLLSELQVLRERSQALMTELELRTRVLLEDVERNSEALQGGLLNLREEVSSFRGEHAANATSAGRKLIQTGSDSDPELDMAVDEETADEPIRPQR
ncbi:MAG: DivIVA domain-containing protein [Actinobacteria bacterium]|uniref:Unannotated protein n=1 Tax=freshwater metagenome TaxID=449393 RepID=A0A6J7E990_9ZZZZ|nr:DivIVA domain-containing protein [Actinomycetota bacterium]